MGHVQNNLGLERLINLRTALFHNGEHHDIPQDVERYIQVVFLDLARASLKLSCKNFVSDYISQGFDLARLDRIKGRSIIASIIR